MKYALLSLLLAFNVHAQVGVSAFAIMHPAFPCTNFLKIFSGVDVAFISILNGTFGKDTKCLKRFMQLPQKKIVQVHMSNEAGRRNNRLFKDDFAYRFSVSKYDYIWRSKRPYLPRLLFSKDVAYFDTFFSHYPNTDVIITEGLESNGSVLAAKHRIDAIRSNTRYDSAYVPLRLSSNWRSVGADYIEQHGASPKIAQNTKCIVNLDGTDIDFNDGRGALDGAISVYKLREYAAKYKRCKVLLWWSSLQGTRGGFKRPIKREFKVYSEQIRAVNTILKRYNNEKR